MLLELVILLLSFAAFVFLKSLKAPASRSCDEDDGPKQKSKVVTLGHMQSVVSFIEFLRNPSVPNYELCQRIARKCGSVLMIKLPFRRRVNLHIADISVAKSIMSSYGWINKFPQNYYFNYFLDREPLGLIFSNGGYWKEGRKVTVKLLHQFGFFREETVEKIVSFEVEEAKREILSKVVQNGGHSTVLKVHHLFELYMLNIVYQFVVGKRFQAGDPVAEKLLSAINDSNGEFDCGTSVLDLLPWLRHVPLFKFYENLVEFNRFSQEHFRKELIEPRRKTGNYKTNPVDFADHFLLEIDRRAGEIPCYLTETNFLACLRDLMSGATDTTNAALEHGILHVCLQPHIQTKVQEEIDQVIGSTREPCYEDRKSMSYTQAVLWEILRFSTPVAIVSRCPLADAEINGSTIPRDSLVGINIYATHHSQELWSDPDDFRPDRFLNEEQNELVNLEKNHALRPR